ncbi:HTH-type transcriptional regulator AscG [subsurface metagenome]
MKTTIADIAKKAKVSKMTVSRVLNGRGHVAKSTIEKVNKVVEESGLKFNF